MSCLLGVVDSIVFNEARLSWDTNKIGGSEILPSGVPRFSHPSCVRCGRSLCLVVQLYCPLEYSVYHRVLYVFACSNPKCWNNSDSWVVYRCQTVDESSVKSRKINTDAKPTLACEDWGTEAGDWGTGADDQWGVGDAFDTGADNHIEGAAGCGTQAGDWVIEDVDDVEKRNCSGESSHSDKAISMSLDNLPSSAEADNETDITDEIPVQKMSLHDSELDPGEAVGSHVIPEDDHKTATDRDRLLKLCEVSESSESNITIIPYYLNVFDEPAYQEEDGSHVTKLLKEYAQKEGIRTYESECFTESGKKGQAEGYERTSVYHKDLIFHKFMKRVAYCPQQCIRYEWDGKPLLMRELPVNEMMTRCQHCGGETLFELQLMPTLVNHLKTTETSGPAVEFGTVLVFTCKQSCWEELSGVRTEHVIVQADPDQELFR